MHGCPGFMLPACTMVQGHPGMSLSPRGGGRKQQLEEGGGTQRPWTALQLEHLGGSPQPPVGPSWLISQLLSPPAPTVYAPGDSTHMRTSFPRAALAPRPCPHTAALPWQLVCTVMCTRPMRHRVRVWGILPTRHLPAVQGMHFVFTNRITLGGYWDRTQQPCRSLPGSQVFFQEPWP